jgi:two-component system CheB/CheR fusion protein
MTPQVPIESSDDALEYAESIINTVREPLLVLDQDLRVVTASRSFYHVFSVNPQETVGQLIYDLGNKQWDIPKLRELLENILPHKATFDNYEVEHDFSTIGRRIMLLNARQIQRVLGKERIILLAIGDITERKATEEALARSYQNKDAFIATLAHELRNPLATIKSAVDLMKTEELDAEKMAEMREIISRQVKQTMQMTEDLLDASRIGRSQLELRTLRVGLSTLVNMAMEVVSPLIDKSGRLLTVSQPEEPLMLEADPTRLTQVLVNLLNNAVKFTPASGHIWLTTERGEGEALVRVRDDGVGIAADDRTRIFEMFAQVTHASQQTRGGLGIGLSLVKTIVELHGGSVEVCSAGLGLGSEFTVHLPLTR